MANTSRAVPSSRDQAEDDLDDLFDYDVDMGDVFQTVDTNMDPVNTTTKKTSTGNNGTRSGAKERGGADLGIDETIKVRARRVNVKLDEERLLSDPGIPKLRRMAVKKLKFKGKGHEFSDVARLLAFYQLWLDDLYPKAKFADALSIIEKLGHSRRMQVMRRQWIDEGKYGNKPGVAASESLRIEAPPQTEVMDLTQAAPQTPPRDLQVEDDLYSATPVAARRQDVIETGVDGGSVAEKGRDDGGDENHEVPEEDELDALLAEEDAGEAHTAAQRVTPGADRRAAEEQNFDDDMEAMAESGMEW